MERPAMDLLYRKVTLRIIPFLFVCYLIAMVDRLNVGFAKLQFMSDLRLTETQFGIAAALLYVGYILFEIPSNLLMQKAGLGATQEGFRVNRVSIGWRSEPRVSSRSSNAVAAGRGSNPQKALPHKLARRLIFAGVFHPADLEVAWCRSDGKLYFCIVEIRTATGSFGWNNDRRASAKIPFVGAERGAADCQTERKRHLRSA
jgi:hypothetical protein